MDTNILKNILVVKRNGRKVLFDGRKIAIAIKKGFDSTQEEYDEALVNDVYKEVIARIEKRYLENPEEGKKLKIEYIQDIIEQVLIEFGYVKVFEKYSYYRETKRKIREVYDERKKYKFLGMLEKLENIENTKGAITKKQIYNTGKQVYNKYVITHKVKKKFIELMDSAEIYIHDLEYILGGLTGFTQIDLKQVFISGLEINNIKKQEPVNIEEALYFTKLLLEFLSKEQYYGEGIPAFDTFFAPFVIKTFKEEFTNILSNNLELLEVKAFLPINGIKREIEKIESIDFDINVFDQYLRESKTIKNIFVKSYKLAYDNCKKRVEKAIFKFMQELQLLIYKEDLKMHYSINTGIETKKEAQIINYGIINAINKLETLDVEIVFKIKEKINLNEDSINHEIYKEFLKIDNENIKYAFLDSKVNKSESEEYNKEVAYLNGYRILENNIDDKRNISTGRGNLANVTINLASIALKEQLNGQRYSLKRVLKKIDERMLSARQILLDRFEEQSIQSKSNFPILLMQEIWLESDKIKEEDRLRRAIKHGTLGISFVGMYEFLTAFGKTKGKKSIKDLKEVALEIVKHMKSKCDEFSEESTLNFQLMSIEENEVKKLFIDKDLVMYGSKKGVTDKEKYTNSYKLDEEMLQKLSIEEIIDWEKDFHLYTPGGHMCVISKEKLEKEFSNLETLQSRKHQLILLAKKAGIGILKIQ